MEAITDPDGVTTTALLNCLRREVAEPGPGGTIRLPRTNVLLRAREGRWLTEPELFSGSWQPVSWQELAVLITKELGDPPVGFLDEIAGSRAAIAAVLDARAAPPPDLYQRSEQALIAGHRYHPAPKGRGGLPSSEWLPYAPEVHARFSLAHLEGSFIDDGEVWQPAPAPRFSRTPGEIRSCAAAVGEHTEELLRQFGFSEEKIAARLASGAIQRLE